MVIIYLALQRSPPPLKLLNYSPYLVAALAFGATKFFMVPSSNPPKTREGGSHLRRDLRLRSPYEQLQGKLLVDMSDSVHSEITVYRSAMSATFQNKEFVALEREAERLRGARGKFGDGSFKIDAFYDGVLAMDHETEANFHEHFAIHRDWEAARPDSLTRQVALAMLLTDYAWFARGSGWANTVTEEGGRLMRQRLNKASQILISASKFKEKDPAWFGAALRVGIGLGFDAKAMDFIVTSAKKDFPDYWPVDCARAYSLLPRWYGESGDWEKYAEIASSNAGGAGPETYARIAIRLMSIHNDLFRETNVSWPRTKEGLELMMERYPDSKLIQSQAAKLGAMALDFHFAKERFDELGSQWIGAAWADADEFVIYRTAARRGRW